MHMHTAKAIVVVMFALVLLVMLACSTSKTASTGWPTTCLRKTNSINTQTYTQLGESLHLLKHTTKHNC